MDNNTMPNNTMPPSYSTPPAGPQNKSSIGGIIGVIIIIALIVLGGLYFWGKRIQETKLEQTMQTEESSPTATSNETADIKNMNSSDSVDSIDADLKATQINNLDAELK